MLMAETRDCRSLLLLLLLPLCCCRSCSWRNPFSVTSHCPLPSLDVRDTDAEPWLTRIHPGEVGDVKILNLVEERTHRRITIADRPILFEIPGFLNDTECDRIIELAKDNGMDHAYTIGYKKVLRDVPQEGQNLSSLYRVSRTTFLDAGGSPLLQTLQRRVSALTQLPLGIVQDSGTMQVGFYGPYGHFHAHFDSGVDWRLGDESIKNCCYQMDLPHTINRCNLCRYVTVLLYLNDVEEGGETAFPVANRNYTGVPAHMYNLSMHCYRSTLVAKPKKGTALFWYNNYLHEETGWLGEIDWHSLHGGCDVIRGEKWIANFWLKAPNFASRNIPRFVKY